MTSSWPKPCRRRLATMNEMVCRRFACHEGWHCSRYFAFKTQGDDSQHVRVTNMTPPGVTKTQIDDSQHGPCNQSDTPRE
jgi:hypothetical protein